MKEVGDVVQVEKGVALVAIPKNKACVGCQACQLGKNGQLSLAAANDLGARVGDRVEVAVRESFLVRGMAALYLGPIVALFAGYFSGAYFSEMSGVIAALAAVASYLLLLRLADRYLAARGVLAARICGIIAP